MADIKLRQKSNILIKTLDETIKTADHSLKAANDIKENINQTSAAGDPASGPADFIQNTGTSAGRYVTRKTAKAAVKGTGRLTKSSIREAVHVKQRVKTAKTSIKTAQLSIKAAKQTAKTGAKKIQTAIKSSRAGVKTAHATIKTANTTVKTANATAKATAQTAKATAQATKVTIQASVQTAKITIQAVIAAAKATATAFAKVVEAFGALLAAGGWIVLVVIAAAALIAVVVCSACGVFSGAEENGQTLSTVEQTLNQEFAEEINRQKNTLQGYSRIEVHPAEIITEWNNIVTVYSVRAQKDGRIAAEMSDDNISLLRETMWDMVSITTSEEEATEVNEGNESGDTEEPSEPEIIGVVSVDYLSLEEAAELYKFSEDDREMMMLTLSMSVGGGYIGGVGNGKMINPCPDGQFNGNDYPTYPSGGYHAGRDISCPIGTPISAAADGVVIHINDQAATYGNHIMIAHGNQVYTLYAHCSELLVEVGDNVTQGQLIALSGNTGNVTGPHLHFEVRVGGSRYKVNNVDPLEWILQRNPSKTKSPFFGTGFFLLCF